MECSEQFLFDIAAGQFILPDNKCIEEILWIRIYKLIGFSVDEKQPYNVGLALTPNISVRLL